MNFLPDRTFPSADAAYDFIFQRYALRPNRQAWKPTASGLMVQTNVPQYIFRGENGRYPETTCTISRLLRGRNPFVPSGQEYLRHLLLGLHHCFTEDGYSLDDHSATALLQHYGLPTCMIDFTANPVHAFSFAAAGKCDAARVAVLPTRSFDSMAVFDSTAAFVDLRTHPWTKRPQRQQAFAIAMPTSMPDLKSEAARSELNVSWYEFPVRSSDREKFLEHHHELLQINNDPSAAFLRFHITEYVEARGKMSHPLADWLLDRIPIAPRCFRIFSFENGQRILHFLPPSHVLGFCEAEEKEHSRTYWSADGVNSFDRMKGWTWPPVGTTATDLRTCHVDLYGCNLTDSRVC